MYVLKQLVLDITLKHQDLEDIKITIISTQAMQIQSQIVVNTKWIIIFRFQQTSINNYTKFDEPAFAFIDLKQNVQVTSRSKLAMDYYRFNSSSVDTKLLLIASVHHCNVFPEGCSLACSFFRYWSPFFACIPCGPQWVNDSSPHHTQLCIDLGLVSSPDTRSTACTSSLFPCSQQGCPPRPQSPSASL